MPCRLLSALSWRVYSFNSTEVRLWPWRVTSQHPHLPGFNSTEVRLWHYRTTIRTKPYQVSILQKYDYDRLHWGLRPRPCQVSILQKYDYDIFSDGRRNVRLTEFQFYRSTIMTIVGGAIILCESVSILQKYDYDTRVGVSQGDLMSFNSTEVRLWPNDGFKYGRFLKFQFYRSTIMT